MVRHHVARWATAALFCVILGAPELPQANAAPEVSEPPVVPFDPKLSVDRYIVIDIYLRTRACMRTSALALMRQGERKRASIEAFMQANCAATLRVVLITRTNWTPTQAEQFLRELAGRVLDDMTITPLS